MDDIEITISEPEYLREPPRVSFTPEQQERVSAIVAHKVGEGRARWMRDAEAKHTALAARVEELEHLTARLLGILEWQVNPAPLEKK